MKNTTIGHTSHKPFAMLSPYAADLPMGTIKTMTATNRAKTALAPYDITVDEQSRIKSLKATTFTAMTVDPTTLKSKVVRMVRLFTNAMQTKTSISRKQSNTSVLPHTSEIHASTTTVILLVMNSLAIVIPSMEVRPIVRKMRMNAPLSYATFLDLLILVIAYTGLYTANASIPCLICDEMKTTRPTLDKRTNKQILPPYRTTTATCTSSDVYNITMTKLLDVTTYVNKTAFSLYPQLMCITAILSRQT